MDPLLHAVCNFVELSDALFRTRQIYKCDSSFIHQAIHLQTNLFECIHSINTISRSTLGYQMYAFVDTRNTQWKIEVWKLWWSFRTFNVISTDTGDAVGT
mmetsp:Transcript_1338/g.1785  ORF Transcript_1338/g.1785 Transcript_1338/m.1785 type:complete len:100 (+) Transcript_1338:83-382(+)